MLVKALIVINVIFVPYGLVKQIWVAGWENLDLPLHVGTWIKWICEMFELLFSF